MRIRCPQSGSPAFCNAIDLAVMILKVMYGSAELIPVVHVADFVIESQRMTQIIGQRVERSIRYAEHIGPRFTQLPAEVPEVGWKMR